MSKDTGKGTWIEEIESRSSIRLRPNRQERRAARARMRNPRKVKRG
jgi:hypothetical protein